MNLLHFRRAQPSSGIPFSLANMALEDERMENNRIAMLHVIRKDLQLLLRRAQDMPIEQAYTQLDTLARRQLKEFRPLMTQHIINWANTNNRIAAVKACEAAVRTSKDWLSLLLAALNQACDAPKEAQTMERLADVITYVFRHITKVMEAERVIENLDNIILREPPARAA